LPKEENKLCSKHFNTDNTVISYKLENQGSISVMGKKFFFLPLPSNWFYPMWVGGGGGYVWGEKGQGKKGALLQFFIPGL